jgi:transketolase
MFGGHFRYDTAHPEYINNDRLIFSKGHAAPLFYALWAVAGEISTDELMTLRTFGSRIEGHPSMAFSHTEVPTGSLGQGLAIGLGMALNAKYLDKIPYQTYVLLGDGEMAEGSVWETMQVASFYKLDNLIGIIDVNRLGQQCETMMGHNLEMYEDKVRAFGWFPIMIDGHDVGEIDGAFETARKIQDRPVMIIAKTYKGKGVSFLEDKEGRHAKALGKEELEKALLELGDVDTSFMIPIRKPDPVTDIPPRALRAHIQTVPYTRDDLIATREAYGYAIGELAQQHKDIIVLDADMSNSTFAEVVKHHTSNQFFEMFIAEQNMVGVGVGLSTRKKIPFISTYAAFLTRAFDQMRMAGYAKANLKIIGSHGGISIGPDGMSQMGLEDIAMMRCL